MAQLPVLQLLRHVLCDMKQRGLTVKPQKTADDVPTMEDYRRMVKSF